MDKKIKKIIITGPESTGKSTLAKQLAEHFESVYVPEFARTYIDHLNRSYREDDLIKIAKGQYDLEYFFYKRAKRFLFCDTSMLVLKIWSEYRFEKCDPWIQEQFEMEEDGLYVLCQTDVPWEPDPQRENPNDRQALYEIFRRELIKNKKEFIEVRGNQKTRLNYVIQSILH